MREIKFRAWNGGMMRYSGMDDILLLENVLLAPDEMGDKWKFREWPLMQYTGLKDKNGKEIYEGDILRIFDSREGILNGRPLPTYQDFKVIWDKIGWSLTQNGFNTCSHYLSYEKEIIGNIYENPELIKEV